MIEEIGIALGSRAPDQRRDCIDYQSEPVFRFLDFVKGLLQGQLCHVLLSDIHVRTDQLKHFTLAPEERMSYGMDVFCRTIGKSYSKIDFKVRFFPDSLPSDFHNPVPIFRKNTIPEGLL